MEKLARKLASKISASLGYDSEKESVVAYGLIALIQISVTVICVLLIGLIVGTPVESLIICFSVSIYRKYSGGAHAGTILKCTIIAVIYCTVFALISKYLLSSIISSFILLVVILPVFFLAYYYIYKKAPVDSPNKPIKSEKKRQRMRRGSVIVLSVYLAASLAFCFFGRANAHFRSYCISLYFGIIWQTFTLTKIGSFVLTEFGRATISKERRLE